MSTTPIPVLQTGTGVAGKSTSPKITAGSLTGANATKLEPGQRGQSGDFAHAATQGEIPGAGDSKGGAYSFAQQLHRFEHQHQEVQKVAITQPLQSDIKLPDGDSGQVLERIGELITAGETLEVTAVQQSVQADIASLEPEVAELIQAVAPVQTEAAKPLVTGPPVLQAAGTKLPHGGQSLPPALAEAAINTDIELPLTAAPLKERGLPVPKGLENAIANRPQFEVAQQPEVVRQPQLEIPTVKLESTLPEAIRAAGALETAALSSNPSTATPSVATTSLVAQASPVTSVAGDAALSEQVTSRPVITINTPYGEQGWAQEVGSRLRMMVEQGNQRAEIRLNPPELGSVEVKVLNDGERTSVTFFAQNSSTREALEAAMPRLREMFDESGLQLADANVSQQQTMAGEREASETGNGSGFGSSDGAAEQEGSEAVRVVSSNSLVDYYI